MGTYLERADKTWLNLATGQGSGGATPPPLLLGSSAGQGTDFDSWSATLANTSGLKAGAKNGGLAAYRSYSSGSIVSSFASTAAAGDPGRGVATIWSCKPPIANVISGALDSTFISFFNSIPAGHTCYLMMWHEPWDDGNGGTFTWANYKAAQERVYDLLVASNADQRFVKWGILGTSFDFQQNRAQGNFFPASGKYDFVGVDGYDFYRNLDNMPSSPRGRNKYRRPAQIYGPTVTFAQSVDKPIVVGEFGFHGDPSYPNGPSSPAGVPSKPYRLQAMLDYFTANNVVVASMFHSSGGDDGPWWFDSFANWSSINDRSNTDTATLTKIRDLLAVYGKAI